MRGNGQEAGDFAALLLEGLQSGSVEVPYWLLQYYPQLRLGEHEVMLLIHLMAFKQKEGKDFPTPEELCARMSIAQDKVITVLQKLMREGFLLIDETKDPVTGVHSEAYNWSPLLNRLAAIRADEWEAARRAQIVSESARGERKDIFFDFREGVRPAVDPDGVRIDHRLVRQGRPSGGIDLGRLEGSGVRRESAFPLH